MIKDFELFWIRRRRRQVERREPARNIFGRRRRQARLREHRTQWIDIASRRRASRERRLDDRRPAPHERVVDHLAGCREAIDEKPRELRLETRAIGNLMKAMRGALLAGPEFVDERFDDDRARLRETDARDGARR